MPVQLTGLAGFDSASVITQLVKVANQPISDLDTKKAKIDSATTTLTSFSTKLSNLKTAATALSTSSGFSSVSAVSSDPAIVPTVSGGATASSYSINVTQLARAQKMRSDAQASSTTALGQAGDLKLKVGSGDEITVSIASTDTLADVASKIGASGARVSASIINAGGSYRLSLQGLDTGAANAVTVTEGGSISLGLGSPANVVETAQDAKLTLDGLEITRPTNQITEAVPGLTLALTKTTTSASTLTVSPDSSALKAKINSFITAFNDVIKSGQTATGYGATRATNTLLAADTSIRRSMQQITSQVTGLVPGASGTYNTLNSTGLSVSRDGVLSLDAAKFDAALQKDPDSVRRLFVTDTKLGATGVMKSMATAIDALITDSNAPVKSRIATLGKQSTSLSDSRVKLQQRVSNYETQLRQQFLNLDTAMSKYNSMSSALDAIRTNNDDD